MEITIKKHKIFGRPRVSEAEKRNVKIAIFLTQSEAEEIKRKCEELNIGLPEFLRRAGLNKKIEARKSTFDLNALEELRAVGQNINQTTRELICVRGGKLSVDFQSLEIILRKQLEVLNRLKTTVMNHSSVETR